MKKLLAISLMALALAGCSAATRYNVSVNIASLIPEAQRSQSFGSTTQNLVFPTSGSGGFLVPLPALEIVEGGRISGTVRLTNTGNTNFTGSYAMRMAPPGDTDISDNQGGDFSLDATSFDLAPGATQDLPINIQISPTVNANALQLIQRQNGFRMALRINVTSTGGSVTLSAARVSVTARPFAAIK